MSWRAAVRVALPIGGLALVILGGAAGLPALAQAQDQDVGTLWEPETFSFDIGEFEKSPWTLDGYVQGDLGLTRFDREAAFYRLSFLLIY